MSSNVFSCDKLTGSENFPIWFYTIYDYLRSVNLSHYVDHDVLNMIPRGTPDGSADSPSSSRLNLFTKADYKSNDAKASIVITNNVCDKIKFFIKNCKSAYDKMAKIKKLYDVDNATMCGLWMKRLYTIHCNSLKDTLEVINEIIEILALLKNYNMEPPLLEQLTIMYDSLPKELQSMVRFTSTTTVNDFLNEINDKYTIISYRRDRGNNFYSKVITPRNSIFTNKNQSKSEIIDRMDIDNINYKYYNNNNKFCIICGNNGHFAKDCYFNPCGTNKNNPRSINNKMNSIKGNGNKNNYRNNKRNNKKYNKFKNNNKSMNNIEFIPTINENTYTPNYEEFTTKYGNELSSIEYANDNDEYDHVIFEIDNPTSVMDSPNDNKSILSNNSSCISRDNYLCSTNIYSDQPDHLHVTSKLPVLNSEILSPSKNDELLCDNLFDKSRDFIFYDPQSENGLLDSKLTVWTYDTGASEHITNDKSILENFTKQRITMRCANKSQCTFEGYGTFTGTINGHEITLKRVLYSKEINKNLISGIELAKDGIDASIKHINNNTTLFVNKGDILMGMFKANGSNIIKIPILQRDFDYINSTELDEKTVKRWHNRLGHYYQEDINKYLKLHNINDNECMECKISKLRRNPHNKNPPRASNILEVIHSDIMGPLTPVSNDNYRYILTFIDEFSRKPWVFLMKDKSEATNIILDFLKYLDNHFNNKVKFFKSDNAKEYNNSRIKKYCKKMGIKKIFSTPYNPENNGIAERYNQTIINSAKTLIFWSKLSLDFWSYAVIYSNYLYSITPHNNISNLIPNEIFYNKIVDISKIKVFGCSVHYFNKQFNSSKFEPNSKEGIFLGIDFDSNSYITMDKENQKNSPCK